jgi:superfamily II DNA or RNA helicase
VIPTAGGKTPVIATICKDAATLWNGRVLILAHVKELLEQAADKLQAICPEVPFGIYSAGLKRRDRNKPVIVAGIQSVYQRACEFDPFDLILIDEAHMITPDGDGMYRQFLAEAKLVNPNVRVVGFTATPYRLSSGPICSPDNIINHICYEIGVRELISQNYLCPLVSKNGKAKADTSKLHIRGGEFVADEVENLMDDDWLVESACAEIVEYTKDRKAVLIFASGIKHGKHIVQVLQDRHGIECGFVTGDTPNNERDTLLKRFREGKLKYLCNVNVLTTGFDAPHIDCIALLRPTMSPGLYYQMCLDMETEILTPRGWARCEDIRAGDLVGAYDLESGLIEWCVAEEKIHRMLAPGEKMYGISAPHLDIRVTHFHTMIYRGRSRTSKHWRKRTAIKLSQFRDSFYIPVAGRGDGCGVPLTNSELRFIGWMLTDGYIHKQSKKAIITQSSQSPWIRQIKNMLRGCGFGYRVYRHRRKGHLAKYPDVLRFVIPFGKPRGKNSNLTGWSKLERYLTRPLTETLIDASRKQLRVLLEAMNLGDGLKRRTLSWNCKTITLCLGDDKALSDDLQALLIQRGFRVNITAFRQRTDWHTKEPKTQYRMHIQEKTEATIGGQGAWPSKLVPHRNRLKELPCKPDEWVWCVKTTLGTIVTRRNGKVAIVGNCGRGFRLHPGKQNCLVLDYGGNVLRHGPVDQIKVKERNEGNGQAPVKECPECRSVIAAGYAKCPDCGYEFPPPERSKHDATASEAGILSGQVTDTTYEIQEVVYSIHKKRGSPPDAPRSMRVDYKVGLYEYKSEWICFEHAGYARKKAIAWWKQRAYEPVPATADEAVTIAQAGRLAPTYKITVRRTAGEKYDQIIDYELGDIPPPPDDRDLSPDALDFPFGANVVASEDEVPW